MIRNLGFSQFDFANDNSRITNTLYDFKPTTLLRFVNNSVVLHSVMGETGSGKSTKLPQFVRDARLFESAIAVTQEKLLFGLVHSQLGLSPIKNT